MTVTNFCLLIISSLKLKCVKLYSLIQFFMNLNFLFFEGMKMSMIINSGVVDSFFSLATVENDFLDQTVRPLIHEIASTKPGNDLLMRIIKIGRNFKIVNYTTTATFPNLNLVQIESGPYFYVTEKNREKFLIEGPKSVRLGHELIHLVHAYENPEAEKKRGESCTCDDMDNEEERLTILGTNHLETDSCNENSLLAAFNLPLRVNHDGPTGQPPTLIDVIKTGALGSLKETLKNAPLEINFVGYCIEAGVKTTLLSAAAYFQKLDIIEFLLNSKVNIHAEDEIGGPILAALKNDHKELAFSLAQRELDRNLKDHKQKTALDYLNDRPTSRFDGRSKPLLKLLSSV